MSDLRPFLDGVAAYLGGLEREPGVLLCRKHRIEHGTTFYLALLDALRVPWAGEEALARALRVALRACDRIREDPAEAYGAWIVLPGSRDPHNHANNAIDAGCGIDALATLGRLHGRNLPAAARDRIEEAVRKVTNTYIAPHAMPKEILAQRLWSLAAMGSAYAWLDEPKWREAGIAAIERTYAQQHPDGSFAYTPLGTPRSHEGSADASSFYHSRHALFLLHALRCFRIDPAKEPHAGVLRRASDFLCSLIRADGTKCLAVEAKPWYWGSAYEVASHPFDAPALAACGEALGEPRYSAAAARLLEVLLSHREPDGGITSHRGAGWSFQCRTFWNAHCAWIAREREALERARAAPAETRSAAEIFWFADAGLARAEDDRMVVLIRGRKPRANLNHGSALGGGGLLYAAAKAAPEMDLVGKRDGDRLLAAEWSVVPADGAGFVRRLTKAWKENREELRFSTWIARVRARSGDRLGAFLWFLSRVRRGLFDAASATASSGTASQADGALAANSLAFRGTVADAFGDPLDGLSTIRRYVFERGCVRVGDALTAQRRLRSCRYRLPRGADQAAFEGASARVKAGIVDFGALPAGSTVAIRYRLLAKGDL